MAHGGYDARRAEELLAMTQDRNQLVPLLNDSVPKLLAEMERPGPGSPSIYLAATGFDFSEFGRAFADAVVGHVCGVACIWTEICSLPFEERVFAVPQHYVEPIGPLETNDRRALLYTQSIIADKGEVLTILSRMVAMVNPVSLTIASVAINSDVKNELEMFLGKYFEAEDLMFTGEALNVNLRGIRSATASCLDDREVKLIPIMSPWLLERRFGTDPEPELGNGRRIGSRGLGG